MALTKAPAELLNLDSSLTISGTTPSLTIGDAGAEDTKIVFDGNAQDFYIGLDDSADDLIIGLGSTVGTTPIISVDENKDVAIPDGSLTITTADNNAQLILVSTDADASTGPQLDLTRNSGSPADSDTLGRIRFNGMDDGGNELSYGHMTYSIVDASDGSEDGKFEIDVRLAGTNRSRMLMTATETVFNNEQVDLDFRVESDDNANMFVVDASEDRVGIGTASPTTITEIRGTVPTLTLADSQNKTWADGDDIARISFFSRDASGNGAHETAFILNENESGGVSLSGALSFGTAAYNTAATEAMRITNSGRVGIGTTGPRGVLDVVGDHAVGYILTVQNDGNNTNRYGIKVVAGSDDSSGTSYLLDFFDGDGTNVGAITNAGGTVSYGAFTAHHPCVIPDEDNDEESTEPAYPYGTLLETTSLSYSKNSDDSDTERGIIYNVQKSSGAYSRKVLGAYGNSMNQGPEEETNKHQVLILGDGHILCNNEKGNISVGDGICTSSTAGIGMKADKMSMIIGIAQEDVTFSGSETKLVAVQYGLQQFTPWTD